MQHRLHCRLDIIHHHLQFVEEEEEAPGQGAEEAAGSAAARQPAPHQRAHAGHTRCTWAGSVVQLARATPVCVTSTDTQGAPAALAPRTSAAGLSPTAKIAEKGSGARAACPLLPLLLP